MLKCHFATHGAPQQLMRDNEAGFTSREFQKFACIWDLCHVTSSPHYPQSNGLAVSTVPLAKQLLEKCACDGTNVYVALLNLRNIPRDGLPSPAQCVLSQCTETLIPMTKAMFVPKTRIRRRGKGHYDRLARHLPAIASRAYGEDKTAKQLLGLGRKYQICKKQTPPPTYT